MTPTGIETATFRFVAQHSLCALWIIADINDVIFGNWSEMRVKPPPPPPEKAKVFCPVFNVGEAHTRRHGYEVLSNVIKFLTGKYRAESYWLQTVQHLTLYGFQAAKRLTLSDITDRLFWFHCIILHFWRWGQLFYSWLWWNYFSSSSSIKYQIIVSLYPQQIFLLQIVDTRNREHVEIIFRTPLVLLNIFMAK